MKYETSSQEIWSHISNKLRSGYSASVSDQICMEPLALEINERKRVTFTSCKFQEPLTILDRSASTYVFSDCVFENILEIHCKHEGAEFEFSNCNITDGMKILKAQWVKLSLNKCYGKGDFIFDGTKFKTCLMPNFKLIENEYKNSISFVECEFETTNFREVLLEDANFNLSTFRKSANFNKCELSYHDMPAWGNFFNCTFEEDAYFGAANFSKGAFFNGSTFNGIAFFEGCNNESSECIGDYSGCTFGGGVFFDAGRFKNLAINQVVFRELASFKNLKCEELELSRCIFLQGTDFLNSNIQKGTRETFRIIKNEFLKHNNQVEALVYRARELSIYENEISIKDKPKEKFVLWLNKVSNEFGINWVRAIGFTLFISNLFFSIYVASLGTPPARWGWNGWESFLLGANDYTKYFLKFFVITHDIGFMDAFQPNAASYLIDSIGRIFVGYGIYQTIQAFRKYGR